MNTHEWSLRLAREADADALPAIERAAAEKFACDPDLQSLDFDETWEPHELRRLIRKGHCLVVEVADRIVGFLASEPFRRELHIWEMDVLPEMQGHGVGAGLIRACQVDARNSGFATLTLTTFRDLPWNGPFYERLGFVEVTELDAHHRLAAYLEEEAEHGLPRERRCAMIHFLD